MFLGREYIKPLTLLLIGEPTRGRPAKSDEFAPIAPYNSDPGRALGKVFDRLTGRAVNQDELKTYAEVLEQYHLSPELKFENGDRVDRGRTERLHIVATGVVWIGKEANRVGESGEADPIWSAVEEFHQTPRASRNARVLGGRPGSTTWSPRGQEFVNFRNQ